MTDNRALEIIGAARLLPVVTLEHVSDAAPLGAALQAGGLHVVEVTFRTAAAEGALRAMAQVDGICPGAGTVLTCDQVDRAVAAGARFVVSPGLSKSVVERCHELRVPVFPGVATPTEVMAAVALNVDVLKLFPAEMIGGLTLIAALAAPFPSVRFIPTGGIAASSAPRYLAHPAVLAVGGSWMVTSQLLSERRWDEITRITAEAVAAARSAGRT